MLAADIDLSLLDNTFNEDVLVSPDFVIKFFNSKNKLQLRFNGSIHVTNKEYHYNNSSAAFREAIELFQDDRLLIEVYTVRDIKYSLVVNNLKDQLWIYWVVSVYKLLVEKNLYIIDTPQPHSGLKVESEESGITKEIRENIWRIFFSGKQDEGGSVDIYLEMRNEAPYFSVSSDYEFFDYAYLLERYDNFVEALECVSVHIDNIRHIAFYCKDNENALSYFDRKKTCILLQNKESKIEYNKEIFRTMTQCLINSKYRRVPQDRYLKTKRA